MSSFLLHLELEWFAASFPFILLHDLSCCLFFWTPWFDWFFSKMGSGTSSHDVSGRQENVGKTACPKAQRLPRVGVPRDEGDEGEVSADHKTCSPVWTGQFEINLSRRCPELVWTLGCLACNGCVQHKTHVFKVFVQLSDCLLLRPFGKMVWCETRVPDKEIEHLAYVEKSGYSCCLYVQVLCFFGSTSMWSLPTEV